MIKHTSSSLISISHVNKEFQLSNKRILKVIKDANFNIPQGSFTIIHGPSGSGKTTLLNILTGLDKPSAGKVLYKGKDIYSIPEQQLAHFRAKTLGMVYQSNYWVASLSVLENVALPLYFLGYNMNDAKKKALESLRQVGMEVHRDTLPSLLSGGEQQRVAIARALVSNPSYIVADEPTGNLDSKNGNDVIELLRDLNEKYKRTIILVTHNDSYLKNASQLLTVKDGSITESVKINRPASTMKSTTANQLLNNTKSSVSKLNIFKPIRSKILVHMTLANLKFKRFRSSLTMLGVAIGIGSVFLLLSFGLGLQNLVQKQIIGTDSIKVINVTSTNSEILKLDEDAIKRFYEIANIEKIGKQNSSAGEIKLSSATADGVVFGVDKNFLELSNLNIISGKQLDPNTSYELVINKSLLKSLGYEDPSKAINQEININIQLEEADKNIQQAYKIVGVNDSGNGSAVYISQSAYTNYGVNEYKQAKVVARDQADIPNIRQQIETYGYTTTSPLDTLLQVNRFFRFFNVILVGFGSIGMFIAVIGMLNTLTITLLERTKEIGLMISLGARRVDMARLFITESLLLSIIGGSIGIVLSIVLQLILNRAMNYMATSRGVSESFSLFAIPIWLILATIVFMCIVGYVVSIIPARRARRISPIETLRNE